MAVVNPTPDRDPLDEMIASLIADPEYTARVESAHQAIQRGEGLSSDEARRRIDRHRRKNDTSPA